MITFKVLCITCNCFALKLIMWFIAFGEGLK